MFFFFFLFLFFFFFFSFSFFSFRNGKIYFLYMRPRLYLEPHIPLVFLLGLGKIIQVRKILSVNKKRKKGGEVHIFDKILIKYKTFNNINLLYFLFLLSSFLGVPFHIHGPVFAEVFHGEKVIYFSFLSLFSSLIFPSFSPSSQRWFLAPPEERISFDPDITSFDWVNDLYPSLRYFYLYI